jgi:uncharacterized membrane protein
MKKMFRIITAIPCWLFLQSIGTLAFTLFGIIPLVGLIAGIGNIIAYLGTGYKEYLEESKDCFEMLISILGGTLVCYSWIQTGNFDIENIGLTHLQKN